MNYKEEAYEKAAAGLMFMLIIVFIFIISTISIVNDNKIKHNQERIDKLKLDILEINKMQEENYNRMKEIEIVEETSSVSIDPKFEALVNATWRLETGNGTSYLWKHYNNAGGIKDYYTGNYVSYQSEEEGMEALRELLLNKYVDKYDYDLKSIRKEYCYQCGDKDYKVFKELFQEELVK